MTGPSPLAYRWDGEAMVPLPRFHNEANAQFVVGAMYRLVEESERSQLSHDHQFAWLTEAWRNLPDELAELYPSPNHLRKRALIEAGYFDETVVDAGTSAAAIRVAAAFRAREEFSHVVVRGPMVAIRTAKSQSRRAMKAPEFQASKTAILEIVAGMIGVAPDELERNAGQAA